eukprot:5350670-Amphidinium_carterae.1
MARRNGGNVASTGKELLASLRERSVDYVPVLQEIVCVATHYELAQASNTKQARFMAMLPGEYACGSMVIVWHDLTITGVGSVTLQQACEHVFFVREGR